MFEDVENFADLFRGLPYYLLLTLPLLIICSSNPVLAASEFNVQRMSQFDVNGVSYGCRASALSLEAKSLYSWSTNRHCVVARLQELTIERFQEIRQKAGGLVILLPSNVSSLEAKHKEHLNLLEEAMLSQSTSIPVYFVPYNEEMDKIIDDITYTSAENDANKSAEQRRGSALSEIFDSISANGYQVIVSGATHVQNKNSRIQIIQGELVPGKLNVKPVEGTVDVQSKLPLIVVTANLKTFGLFNTYPVNADAAALVALAELFSKLSSVPNTMPKYRLLFVLSEGGPLLNFQGAKKWLDENVQLQNLEFVLCLDTIIQPLAGAAGSSPLYMHVSKPPKEGSSVSNFYKTLKNVAAEYSNLTVEGVHKKINLADTQLAWEHERFSMRRLPAFTLSALKSPKEAVRNTVFRDEEAQLFSKTQEKVKIVAEALARHIYNVQESSDIFAGSLAIQQQYVKGLLQLKSLLHNNDLKNGFDKYLRNVKVLNEKPDTREPDFMLYEGQDATLNIYRVKPAVFDLFLTVLIVAYLCVFYLCVQNFHIFYGFACKLSKRPNVTANGHYNEKSSKNKHK